MDYQKEMHKQVKTTQGVINRLEKNIQSSNNSGYDMIHLINTGIGGLRKIRKLYIENEVLTKPEYNKIRKQLKDWDLI
ncbi:hypothetical protein ACFL3E_00390 [Patescibacteria group bacterium]